MPSQREIAKHWGCKQQHVGRCVKKGCPTDTLEAADAWRATHTTRGVGYRSTPATPAPKASEQPAPSANVSTSTTPKPPLPVVPASRLPPPKPLAQVAGDKPPISGPAPHPRQPKAGAEALPGPEPVEKITRELVTIKDRGRLESLEGSLQAAIDIETEAHKMVEEAMKDGSALGAARLPALLTTYNNAKNGRMAAEKSVRALQREENILVPLETAKQLVARVWQPHIIKLRALSKRASRANPNDKVFAEEIISQEVEALIADTLLLYNQLIETGTVSDPTAPV